MANNGLLAIVTVLILIGQPGHAQSDPTIEELLTIEKFIETGNWRALFIYVEANPKLSSGNSPLAVELRSFANEVESGKLNAFNAGPAQTLEDEGPQSDANFSIY